MLNKLIIQNFAIIDQLEIDFHSDLNIITGETGAGKSIILGALSLLLGQRADVKSLKKTDQKCIIEGYFSIEKFEMKSFFDENELDYENESILRREISVDGKSRAFINDTPVNLALLRALSEKLVDIHSQHETLNLNDKSFQLSVIDSVCNHKELLISYQRNFKKFSQNKLKYQELIHQNNQNKIELDFIQFQFNELNDAKLSLDEQPLLESEQQQLIHAEEIKSALAIIYGILNDSKDSVNNQLKTAISNLSGLDKYLTTINSLKERLNSSLIELRDVADEIETIANQTILDPNRLEIIQDRLNLIFRLQQKHRVQNNNELIELMNSFDSKLLSFSSIDDQILKLKIELEKDNSELVKQAEILSSNRSQAVNEVEKQINSLLKDVGMPNANFIVQQERLTLELMNDHGLDKINFLFSANKGFSPTDLSKVASGGELSRLMLCIKSMIAKKENLATIVFDEIDTGISGEVANKVGQILKALSKNLQVISITHLPQIAGFGSAHYYVYKEIKKEKTFTNIKLLSEDERIVEIAKMLSGDNPSDIAIENAKELLK